jgi:hypothetical protein
MRRAIAAFLLGVCLASFANAKSAEDLYNSGNFPAAVIAGEQEGGAAGNLAAARGLLALAMRDFRAAETRPLLDRAQRHCETALAADPNSVQARLQLATTLGMKGRRASLKEAMHEGYAKRGRTLIEEALKLSPEEPRAHALLGGWNLEVVRRGGAIGSALMGASTRAGIRSFDRARALAPDDPAIAFHYGMALLSLDAERYAQKAGVLLSNAANAAPRNAFETRVRDEARRLSAVLASQGAIAAANAVAAYL